MKIKDRAKPKTPPVEPGVYIAICIGVVDLGEQYSEKFKNYANKVKFIWELVGETIEVDGEQKPRQLSKEFTFSISKRGACGPSWDPGMAKSTATRSSERLICLTRSGRPASFRWCSMKPANMPTWQT